MVFLPASALIGVPSSSDWPSAYSFYTLGDSGGSWAQALLDFFPNTPGFNATYSYGVLPSYEWLVHWRFTEIELTGNLQILVKADIVSTTSGFQEHLTWNDALDLEGQWLDLWDYWELRISDLLWNGVSEEYVVNISMARDDGFGSPESGTIKVKQFTFMAFRGFESYIIWDEFTDAGSNLESHTPNTNRTVTSEPWLDLYWNEGDETQGYFSIVNNNAKSANYLTGVALYTVDTEVTDLSFCTDINYASGVTAGVVGRVQDTDNHWRLEVTDSDTADPVLNLVKILAGTPSVVATKTLTGHGPWAPGEWHPMRLEFSGDDIIGAVDIGEEGGLTFEPLEVLYNDATFNTETRAGIWASNYDVVFRRMTVVASTPGFDAIVWSTSPFTSTITDAGSIYNNIYFHENNSAMGGPPYHSACAYWIDASTIGYKPVIDDKLTTFNTDTFVIKAQAISGDTDGITIREYGTTPTAFDTWMDLYRCDIVHEVDESESKSCVIDVIVAVDDGTTNPLAGTEVTKRITFNSTSTGA